MKPLVAFLFLLGTGWALLAWMVVLLPLGIMMPDQRYQLDDTLFSLLASALAIVGYWIWFGWGFYLWAGRFPGISRRRFWSVSLVLHVLWAFAIPLGVLVFAGDDFWMYPKAFVEFWRDGQDLPFRSWIAFNILVAAVAFWNEGDPEGCTSEKLEPSVDPGR